MWTYNNNIKNSNIAFAMLTGDARLRICFYDPNYESFYKISRIYVKTKNNQIIDYDTYVKNNYDFSKANGHGRK